MNFRTFIDFSAIVRDNKIGTLGLHRSHARYSDHGQVIATTSMHMLGCLHGRSSIAVVVDGRLCFWWRQDWQMDCPASSLASSEYMRRHRVGDDLQSIHELLHAVTLRGHRPLRHRYAQFSVTTFCWLFACPLDIRQDVFRLTWRIYTHTT